MRQLDTLKDQLKNNPEGQVSLTDPDARSMATSRLGSGIVGYIVQVAVDAKHHPIVVHEVTNDSSDRSKLSLLWHYSSAAMVKLQAAGRMPTAATSQQPELKACDDAGIATYVPKSMTSCEGPDGASTKSDFIYITSGTGRNQCPRSTGHLDRFTGRGAGLRYVACWSSACPRCPIKQQCTPSDYRRISREHEHVLKRFSGGWTSGRVR